MKKKEKKKIGGKLVMVLLSLAMGIAGGLVLGPVFGALKDLSFFVILVLVFAIFWFGIMLQIAIHEAGHLVFGLLTGYRFVSYRIGSFMWTKIHGKIYLKRYSLAGTGGQCLLAPPDYREGQFPVALYNLGGPLMNLIAAAIFTVPAILVSGPLSGFFWLLVVIGVGFALTNGIPLSTGAIDNDGKNALSLSKDPKALRAFWVQMQINAQLTEGLRLREMPEEWFAVPADEDLGNPMISALGVFAANRLMDERRFEEADALMAHLLDTAENMLGMYRELLINDRIFCEIMGRNRREVIEGFCTKSHQKMMRAMKNLPCVMRTQYALDSLLTGYVGRAAKTEAKFDKMKKTYPYAGELEGEKRLAEMTDPDVL